MKDRVPQNPGRVKITRADGSSEFVTIERADNPVQVGTALNKGTLLSDSAAAAIGLTGDPTVSDALNKLADVADQSIRRDIDTVWGTLQKHPTTLVIDSYADSTRIHASKSKGYLFTANHVEPTYTSSSSGTITACEWPSGGKTPAQLGFTVNASGDDCIVSATSIHSYGTSSKYQSEARAGYISATIPSTLFGNFTQNGNKKIIVTAYIDSATGSISISDGVKYKSLSTKYTDTSVTLILDPTASDYASLSASSLKQVTIVLWGSVKENDKDKYEGSSVDLGRLKVTYEDIYPMATYNAEVVSQPLASLYPVSRAVAQVKSANSLAPAGCTFNFSVSLDGGTTFRQVALDQALDLSTMAGAKTPNVVLKYAMQGSTLKNNLPIINGVALGWR